MYLYGDAKEKYDKAIGKVIASASVDDELRLKFEDGTSLTVYDGGQSCCEARYVTCDDNPSDLVGKPFVGIEEKPTSDDESNDDYMVHETMFVEVRAGCDSITMTTHNEHNGYYGGFSIQVR